MSKSKRPADAAARKEGKLNRYGIAGVPASERDWTEDFPHENGNYVCNCCECKQTFYGHKRRVVCKVCAAPRKDAGSAAAPTPDEERIEEIKGLLASGKVGVVDKKDVLIILSALDHANSNADNERLRADEAEAERDEAKHKEIVANQWAADNISTCRAWKKRAEEYEAGKEVAEAWAERMRKALEKLRADFEDGAKPLDEWASREEQNYHEDALLVVTICNEALSVPGSEEGEDQP